MSMHPSIGSNLRRLRRQAGLTQEQLAEQAGLPADTVRKLEQGQRRVARIATLHALADALHADLAALVVEKRAPAAMVSQPISAESLRATTEKLVALDSDFGGDDVLNLALRAWRTATAEHAPRSTIDREMLSALADLAQLASWAAYDAEQHDTARRMGLEALHGSRLAGDRTTELFALDGLAMQAVRQGEAGDVFSLTDAVTSSGHLPRRVLAITHIRRGGGEALAGRRQRARREFEAARAALLEGTDASDPAWTWWIDETEIDWNEGVALRRLGDPAAAADGFRVALAASGETAPRSRWGTLAHLFDAEVAAQDWSAAEARVEPILNGLGHHGSTRIAAVLTRAARTILHATGPSSTLTDAAVTLLGADG